MTRDEVLTEFHQTHAYEREDGVRRTEMYLNTDAMADEIVRLRDRLAAVEAERDEAKLRLYSCVQLLPPNTLAGDLQTARDKYDSAERILAALREPSNAVVMAGVDDFDGRKSYADPDSVVAQIICAAVAAAEKEVTA